MKIKLAVVQVEVGRKSEKKQQNALIVKKMKFLNITGGDGAGKGDEPG